MLPSALHMWICWSGRHFWINNFSNYRIGHLDTCTFPLYMFITGAGPESLFVWLLAPYQLPRWQPTFMGCGGRWPQLWRQNQKLCIFFYTFNLFFSLWNLIFLNIFYWWEIHRSPFNLCKVSACVRPKSPGGWALLGPSNLSRHS